ncbi:MAG: helix-turn-helix transcriptional regulator [Planctomycetota bacterium]
MTPPKDPPQDPHNHPTFDRLYDAEVYLDKQVGTIIREARTAIGLSQENILTLMGLPPEQLEEHETGEIGLSVARLHVIWPCLDLSPAELFERLPAITFTHLGPRRF